MKRWAAALAGMVLAASLGYYLGHTDRPADTPTIAVAPAQPAPSAPATQASAPATPRTASTPAAAPSEGLVYRRLLVDTSRAAPEACLMFSEPLASDPATHYEDYLKVEPAAKLAVKATESRLCLGGLEFRNEYTVTIAAGLPAASGARSLAPQTITVSLGEQPKMVGFATNGFILPRQGSDGVGVQTINVDKVKIKVSRIGDRILARTKLLKPKADDEYGWYGREVPADATTLVWQGEMSVERAHNQRVTTMFPLADVLKPRRPGAYLIEADIRKPRANNGGDDDDGYYYDNNSRLSATQWVIDTDIALTSLRGTDGLQVFARSLDTAKPIAGAAVTLVAVNNDELGRAVTDANGRATFDPGLLRGKGGAAPSVVMAFGADDDFTALDLKRPAFDLSDRGVNGRAIPGPVDAFVYTDRGIYRPGETVNLTVLLRDRVAAAIDGTPVVLTINRPDGVAFRRMTLDGAKAGAVTVPFILGDTASRGLWSAVASLDGATDPVGRVEFDVQDFVPQRLKVTLSTGATALRLNEPVEVAVNGRFLYGAPAAELGAEGEVKLTPEREPFADHKGFRVGLFDDAFKEHTLPLQVEPTGTDGITKTEVALRDVPPTSMVLKAAIRVGLFEPGGRITSDRIILPVATKPIALGLRPRFTDDRVQENSQATFEVRAFDAAGKPVARKGVRWEVIDELWDYSWFFSESRWQYQTVVRDRPMASGTLDLEADKVVELSQRVGWGRYRVTITDPETGAATSMRFRGGWQATAEAGDTPDKVEVTVAQPQYRVGETARVNIKPPFAGELLLTIASDKVFETKTLSVPAEGVTVDIKTAAEWGTGAYVLASFYRPLASGRPRDVVRAIGLAWIGLDLTERTLGVTMKLPDVVAPRQRLTVDLKVDRVRRDEPVFLTLAAVDEGILQLTRFASPQPHRYYFGKRRLAVEIRDDYARLLDGKGTVGQIRSGGDGMGGRGLPVVPTKSVALFSGIVAVGADGTAQVPIEIPDFNGQLRIMAVAFSKTMVGAGDAYLTVRDPVIAEVILPRFLAPADQAQMTLQLHNVDNPAGSYRVRLSTVGPLAVEGGERTYELARDGRRIETIPLRATFAGIATISLAVEGPGNFAIARDYSITVRSPHYPIAVEQAALQPPDAAFKIDPALLEAFVPGDVAVALSYSSLRGIDVAGLLQSLDRYPHGCAEQLTSRAFPLIYFNDLALLQAKPQDKGIPWRVQDAIDKLVQRQGADGAFGLWRVGDGAASPWLQVFVTDFLARAKQARFDVPTDVLARAYKRLQSEGNGSSSGYGAYVLARANLADLGELRYMHDQGMSKMSALSAGHLAGALALMGDRARAASAFEVARRDTGYGPDNDYYRTRLRDTAALVSIAAETRQTDVLQALISDLESVTRDARWTSTQEQAWLLIAANSMIRNAGPVQLSVNGLAPVSTALPSTFKPTAEQVIRGYGVTNRSTGEVWRSLVLHGTPKDAPPSLSAGLTIDKQLLTLEGTRADLAAVRQNDRLIVSISGRATRGDLIPAVLVDMLPAGFEIEAVLQRGENGETSYSFLPTMNVARTREARDDRFVAAFDLNNRNDDGYYYNDRNNRRPDWAAYHVAYVVRAVTPGTFVMPAASVEDMYKPEVMGRGEVQRVTIVPR